MIVPLLFKKREREREPLYSGYLTTALDSAPDIIIFHLKSASYYAQIIDELTLTNLRLACIVL